MKNNTLSNLLPRFIKDLENKKRSPSTILAYRADIEQMINFLKSKNIAFVNEVKTDHIDNFKEYLISLKYTLKSVSRKLNAVKTFFSFLEKDGIISQNPAERVEYPKAKPNLPKFLSELQYRALRDATRKDLRAYTMIELILQTGMRISEVANLKLKDIKEDKLIIRAYATQPERTVPLNNAAKTALKNFLTQRPKIDSEFVFTSKNGKPLATRNIRSSLEKYFKKAQIPEFTVNDLRSTFIVENLKKGVDLITISQVVGHKRLSTTERYLELAQIKTPGKKLELEEL